MCTFGAFYVGTRERQCRLLVASNCRFRRPDHFFLLLPPRPMKATWAAWQIESTGARDVPPIDFFSAFWCEIPASMDRPQRNENSEACVSIQRAGIDTQVAGAVRAAAAAVSVAMSPNERASRQTKEQKPVRRVGGSYFVY